MVIANVNRGPKQSAYTVEDFMPKERGPEQTPEQQAEMLRIIAVMTGGVVE